MTNECFFMGCKEATNLCRLNDKDTLNGRLRRDRWLGNSSIDFVKKPLKKNTKDVRVCRKHFHIKCFVLDENLCLVSKYGNLAIRQDVAH